MDTDVESAISAHRYRIDLIDQEILRLVMLRSIRAKDIIKLRRAEGGPQRDTQREAAVLGNYRRYLGFDGFVIGQQVLKISREWEPIE